MSHMDLLEEANRPGWGVQQDGAESTEKRVIRWARWRGWGVVEKRGLAGPSGREASNMWGRGGRKVKFGISMLKRKLKAAF